MNAKKIGLLIISALILSLGLFFGGIWLKEAVFLDNREKITEAAFNRFQVLGTVLVVVGACAFVGTFVWLNRLTRTK